VTFLRKLIRGAASTSYGIYCAKIAGIPEPIIERAYQILSTLEIRSTELQTAVSLAQPVQLSLFPDEMPDSKTGAGRDRGKDRSRRPEQAKSDERPVRSDRADIEATPQPDAAPVNTSAQEIYKRVHEADLMNMTPLEAMQFILELKSIR